MKTDNYFSRLVSNLAQTDWNAILIAPSEDMEFLFGGKTYLCERFQGIFITRDGKRFVVCNLLSVEEYRRILGRKIPIYSWSDSMGFEDAVLQACHDYGLLNGKIGVNAAVRAFNLAAISFRTNWQIENAVPLLQEIRIRKTEEEQRALRASSKITDNVFEQILPFIKPNVTELEIQAEFVRLFKDAGASYSYSLVASGVFTAMPHYSATEKIIEFGDTLILDFGCSYQGMCSDMTRTVFVGSVSEEQRRVYDIVLQANLIAEELIQPGAFIPDIDHAARNIITATGYGDYFPTRLGHGIGYCVHEAPDIRHNNERHIEPSMAFTIEPGIYIPEQFGIRIEDVVLVTEQGAEILNRSSKELLVIS